MILVTGGAGYIGSHCVRELLDIGNEVIVLDNLSTGYLEAIDQRAKFYEVDLNDKDSLIEVFNSNKIEGVIHFAAFSLVGESMEKPFKYYRNNLAGMITLLECMKEYSVKRIVFSSSAAVYGEHTDMPITEEYDTLPTNVYGETKLAMEKMIQWAKEAYGLEYVALRYFNVAGAHKSGMIGEAHNPETHLIPLVMQVPLGRRESISIFGDDYNTPDGTCIRDYIHISDLVEAHILAYNYTENNSGIFNLGSEDGFSVKEIIENVENITERSIKKVIGQRRAGDPAMLIASSQKARDVLGWKRRYGIEDIISSAWKFHQMNPDGYQK